MNMSTTTRTWGYKRRVVFSLKQTSPQINVRQYLASFNQ